ncbi:hypothetical protein [Aminobacter sp. AP02]|uniref:hypothetical protein n=1 Tax=Aminobacter sp. AP02 TaxID=2135737 RepID=UPI000D6BE87A|nr:hypothetical protein [Aminobacter sp. AP02]PWK66946.1 hypothetical protein C8K44_11362 [Aminobacter sp. AP02]
MSIHALANQVFANNNPEGAEEVGSFTLKVNGRTFKRPNGDEVFVATRIKSEDSVELVTSEDE